MTTARLLRPRSGLHADPLAGRLLVAYLVSLLLHALLLFGVTGGWLSSSPRQDQPPVYYVDLVHKPVLNPQAGRPEPRAAAPAPTPVPAPVAPVAKVEPKTTVPSKSAPPAKTPAQPADTHVRDALQQLRDEQALQSKLAALRQTQAVPAEVPVGLPDARGDEAGVSPLVYVKNFIQDRWALNPYQLKDASKMAQLNVSVVLTYDKNGRLVSYRIEKESGDPQFDESIKRALVKSQQLPQPLPVRLEDVRVVFNLKSMAELR